MTIRRLSKAHPLYQPVTEVGKEIACYYCGELAMWTDLETQRPTCPACKDAVTPSTVWQGGRRSGWERIKGAFRVICFRKVVWQ
jgi:hypothetical protein